MTIRGSDISLKDLKLLKDKTLFVACDHAGLPLKNHILQNLETVTVEDLGTQTEDSVDYPDFADRLAQAMPEEGYGLLICGSGQGISMRANKFSHIRAALCWNEEVAELARQHNNANVLSLGSRVIDHDLALKIVESFFNTEFEGGRHERRVGKIGKDV